MKALPWILGGVAIAGLVQAAVARSALTRRVAELEHRVYVAHQQGDEALEEQFIANRLAENQDRLIAAAAIRGEWNLQLTAAQLHEIALLELRVS